MYEEFINKEIKIVYQDGDKVSIIERGVLLNFDSETDSLLVEDLIRNNKQIILRPRLFKVVIL